MKLLIILFLFLTPALAGPGPGYIDNLTVFGNVGIGSSNPTSALDISGNTIQGNPYIKVQRLCQTQDITTDSTQKTSFSIGPIPQNKNYVVRMTVIVVQNDYSKGNSGLIQGSFVRGTGNLSRDGTLTKLTTGNLSGAGIDFVANTSTQSIDIKISGTANTVYWNFYPELIYNAS